jgi:hypothetical protein
MKLIQEGGNEDSFPPSFLRGRLLESGESQLMDGIGEVVFRRPNWLLTPFRAGV